MKRYKVSSVIPLSAITLIAACNNEYQPYTYTAPSTNSTPATPSYLPPKNYYQPKILNEKDELREEIAYLKKINKPATNDEGSYGSAFSCSKRKEFYNSAFENLRTEKEIFNEVIKPDTKVVFLSEQHFNVAGIKRYSTLIKIIKKDHPELDCVFLEYQHDYEEIFNQYLSGEKTYYESVGHLFDTEWKVFDRINSTRSELFYLAKKQSIKIIPIDMTLEERKGRIYTDASSQKFRKLLKTRNAAMAKRIYNAFAEDSNGSTQCKLALMPIGTGHLSFHYPINTDSNRHTAEKTKHPNFETLPEMISKMGIHSTSIKIIGTRSGKSNSEEWRSRADCDEKNYVHTTEKVGYGFIVPTENNDIPIELYNYVSIWKDFSAGIIVPNYDWQPSLF